MPLAGFPLDKQTKRNLEVGLRSTRVGRIVAYLLNRSGERVTQKGVAGGAAGNITVTGIAVLDRLVSVFYQDAGTQLISDLSSEFTITAVNTINNAGGTNTAGGVLLVTYGDRT